MKITPQVQQHFSIPFPIIKYITSNSKRPKAYFKLINSCKYFYYKNHIIVGTGVNNFGSNYWEIIPYSRTFKGFYAPTIEVDNFPCKVWILNSLNCSGDSYFEKFLPKIYRCDATFLLIEKQRLSFKDFLFLSSSVIHLELLKTSVEYDDGTLVMFETILGSLKNVVSFKYKFSKKIASFSFETMKEISTLKNMENLQEMVLENISENFDFKTFVLFLKEHKIAEFQLEFKIVSEENKIMIDEFVETILEGSDDMKVCICYEGMNDEKKWALQEQFRRR